MSDDTRQMLDPEIAELVEGFQLTLTNESLADFRSAPMGAAVELSDTVTRTDHTVPGDPDVTVRVHQPVGTKAGDGRPCVYSIHGGGYVLGSYEMDDALFDRWCNALGIVGVSVEYRLAPDTPYPGAITDCYRGLKWTFEHAEELGIDPECIGIRGISAGGGLAAALALVARDRGEVQVAFQLLDCPMLDDRQLTASSRLDGLAVWSREANEFGWRSYLGELYGKPDVPTHAAPARETDLSGLPPAFVSVGTVDGFRDEDVDYATRLNQAGVPTELHVYPGACHGYQIAAESAVARQSTRDADDWLARQVRRTSKV
jgi:acetyl esterase/lipase